MFSINFPRRFFLCIWSWGQLKNVFLITRTCKTNIKFFFAGCTGVYSQHSVAHNLFHRRLQVSSLFCLVINLKRRIFTCGQKLQYSQLNFISIVYLILAVFRLSCLIIANRVIVLKYTILGTFQRLFRFYWRFCSRRIKIK